jgi:hypothetical protein
MANVDGSACHYGSVPVANTAGNTYHYGGLRVTSTTEYYILVEWNDAGEAMPPSYDQAKN